MWSVDISHHEPRYGICGHPERDAIEEAFLQWRSSLSIQLEFRLPSRITIFRHAHAFGLFERRRNLRFSLEHIIEGAERVKPTAQRCFAPFMPTRKSQTPASG
jgi:hypothetical protein